MNIFNPALFAAGAPCLPCCGPAGPCQCDLVGPLAYDGSANYSKYKYPDYASAAAGIAASALNCLVFAYSDNPTQGSLVSGSAAFNGTQLDVSLSLDSPSPSYLWLWAASISLKAGSTLNVVCSNSGGNPVLFAPTVSLYDCQGNPVQKDQSNFGLPHTFSVPSSGGIPADGEYILIVENNTEEGGLLATTMLYSVTCDDVFTVNPVVVEWDDSGTTRQLEACPKMLLPLSTEVSGNWYADCASAAAVLSNPLMVSNCIGYLNNFWDSSDTFTATDLGTSLLFSYSSAFDFSSFGNCAASVNLDAGATVTLTWASAFALGSLVIRDYSGLTVFSSTAGTPITSIALPYTGRYFIICQTSLGPGGISSADMTIATSGSMSVNQIQALYDVGLDCPARLNCGDSCP